MSETEKRNYRSPARDQRALRTRGEIVSAAATLYLRDGYIGATVDAIAELAGVNRKTVFTTVGGKAELLKGAIDRATVGDDAAVTLANRPSVQDIGALTDPHLILEAYADIITDIDVRLAPLSQVLAVAATIEEPARLVREDAVAQRLSGSKAFVGYLQYRGGLRGGLDIDTAADLVWLHSDPILYHRLVIERGWSVGQFRAWLLLSLRSQLLP